MERRRLHFYSRLCLRYKISSSEENFLPQSWLVFESVTVQSNKSNTACPSKAPLADDDDDAPEFLS